MILYLEGASGPKENLLAEAGRVYLIEDPESD